MIRHTRRRLVAAAALGLAVCMTIVVSTATFAAARPDRGGMGVRALGKMAYWGTGGNSIIFYYGSPSSDGEQSSVALPYQIAPPKAAFDQWEKGFDNPAPLLWYAAHVNRTWAGTAFRGLYSPSLIRVMNAEHFNPAMIGGTSVKGLTTPPNATWSLSEAWLMPPHGPKLWHRFGRTSRSTGLTTPVVRHPQAKTHH